MTDVRKEIIMIHSLNETLKESVLNSCMRIASSRQSQIIAACLYGPRACGYSEEESDANVLLVLRRFRPRARGYREPLKMMLREAGSESLPPTRS